LIERKFIFKKLCLTLSMAGLFAASSVNAITVTDPLNTLQNALNNLQDIDHRIYQEVEAQANRMLQKELSKFGMENDANQAAQELVATQRSETYQRNHEVAMEQAPLVDVCQDTAMISLSMDGDYDCYRDSLTQDYLAKMRNRRDVGYDATPDELEVLSATDSEETLDACLTELHSQGNAIQSVDASESHCFDSSALVDSNLTTLQSGVEERGAEEAVRILSEPVIREKAYGSSDLVTPAGRAKNLNEQRKDMLIELAQSVMLHNVEIRRSSKWADTAKTKPLPSVLETLDSFNNNRLLSEGGEYLLKLGAAHKDKFNANPDIAIDSTFNINQVHRETAVMTAFLSHMAVLQYKSQLRIEQLEAALLSLEVNPVE
jgi:predicted DNA-binding WGR domain protein